MSAYINGKEVCIVTGGGAKGHKVYLINANTTDDTGLIAQNDEDMYNLTYGQGNSSKAYSILSGVESISLTGFGHWMNSIGSSSYSWGAWRPHASDWQSWNGTGGTIIQNAKYGIAVTPVTQDIDLIIHSGTCLTGDMLILMADGSEKQVKDIQVGDMVMTPNGAEKVTWSDSNVVQYGEGVDHWYFGDTEIKTINPHRFYNVERGAFIYLHDWKIGQHTLNVKGEKIRLNRHVGTTDKERHYTIFVSGCNAYYVNGLLSGNRFSRWTL